MSSLNPSPGLTSLQLELNALDDPLSFKKGITYAKPSCVLELNDCTLPLLGDTQEC